VDNVRWHGSGKDLLREMNGGQDISVSEIVARYREMQSSPEGREHIRCRAEELSRQAKLMFGQEGA